MKYRTLGRTGLRCSEIGLGTWAFASQVYGEVTESDALNTIKAALDAGVNFFDTAPLYGTSKRDGVAEEILGKTSVEESLHRLGTDHIDILFFHSPFSPDEIHDDVWGALNDLRDQGKIRFIGHSISMFQDTQQMARDWADERKIDVIQVVYSLLNREATKLIEDLGRNNIGIVARESLANGFLSGKLTKNATFASNNLNARYSREEIIERVEQVERLSFLIRNDIHSMPQAAMRWVLNNTSISLVLSGAKNPHEILECAAASDAEYYTSEEIERAALLHHKDFQAA
jgi:aryl-alcohol dehydrogenase-like predicted oxidoreductase